MKEPKSETSNPTVVNPEVKLKEISRKAKERKTTTPRKTPSPRPKGWTNLNLFLAGGLGAGIIGILYLILREPGKTEYKFVPAKTEEPEKRNLRRKRSLSKQNRMHQSLN